MGWRHAEGISKSRNLSSAAVQSCLNYSPAHLSLRKTPDTCLTNVYKRNPLHNSCQETIEQNTNRDKNVKTHTQTGTRSGKLYSVQLCIPFSCSSHWGSRAWQFPSRHTVDAHTFSLYFPLRRKRSSVHCRLHSQSIAHIALCIHSPLHTISTIIQNAIFCCAAPFPQHKRDTNNHPAYKSFVQSQSTSVTPTIMQHTKVLCGAK